MINNGIPFTLHAMIDCKNVLNFYVSCAILIAFGFGKENKMFVLRRDCNFQQIIHPVIRFLYLQYININHWRPFNPAAISTYKVC